MSSSDDLSAAREVADGVLQRHHAAGQVDAASLAQRRHALRLATTPAALRAVMADLPPLVLSDREYRALTPDLVTEPVRGERRVAAVLTTKRLEGDWELARRTSVLAMLAELRLDLREARIPDGVSELHITATLSEVTVLVPPGVRVACEGHAILGEFTHEASRHRVTDPDHAPLLRITGSATLSEVTVRTRLPDELEARMPRRRWWQR
jgi:hypothetical protein